MINLFERFSSQYIPQLMRLKKIYLVSQTYAGAVSILAEENKIRLLFSDYDDKGLATVHKAAVKNDKYAAIIDLSNEKHMETLHEMLSPDSRYLVYWAVVKNKEQFIKRVRLKYKDNIRRYVIKNIRWRIGADEDINPHVQLVFGELFVILRRSGWEDIRVKFVDIEKA